MKDIRQSKQYANYLSSIGWEAKLYKNNYYFVKKIFFLTTIKLQRPKKINYKNILEIKNKYKGIINFLIEPKEETNLKGFKQINPFLPSKTLMLNLNKSQNKIYNNFSKDARYALRKVNSSQITVQSTNNLELFHKSWKASVPISRHVLSLKKLKSLKKAFGRNMTLIAGLPRDERSEFYGGAIFLVANNTGYYWQAFTSPAGRKSLVQYKIVYEGIKWCKQRGAKHFDFEGIYDSRFPLKKWQGFSKFKSKFGGKEVEFPGAYSKWFLNL